MTGHDEAMTQLTDIGGRYNHAAARIVFDYIAELEAENESGEALASAKFYKAECDRLRAQVGRVEDVVAAAKAKSLHPDRAAVYVSEVESALGVAVPEPTETPDEKLLRDIFTDPAQRPQTVPGRVAEEWDNPEDAVYDDLSIEELDDLVMRQQVARMAGQDPDAVPLRPAVQRKDEGEQK